MKERTISLEYKGHKEYKYIMPGEILTTIPCYEITVTWNNKIIEFKNRKMPLTESTVFISACKLNKEEEQRVIKELENAPLNMSLEKLMDMAIDSVTKIEEEWE